MPKTPPIVAKKQETSTEIPQKQETPQETPETREKQEYRKLIENYRRKNPAKYEQKKADFERKLKGDIRIQTGKQGKRRTFVFYNTPPKK